jgi:hypothetical protein
MSLRVGAVIERAGKIVKLLNKYLSSASRLGGSGRPHQPPPRDRPETAEKVERKEARDRVSALSPDAPGNRLM